MHSAWAAVAILAGLMLVARVQAGEVRGTAGGDIPVAEDTPYPGTISLNVDLTDLDRRVFNVRESIPVKPGSLTLLYPQWLPGEHAPRGQIEALAGLTITASGHRVEWLRDPVNMYAFHVVVPLGSNRLDLEFQFASPLVSDQGSALVTPDIARVPWNTLVLYPAGYYVGRIAVAPSITLPENWKFAGAVDIESRGSAAVHFKPMTLAMLVDSPLFAGRYFKRLDLAPGARVPVHLNLVADSPESLEVSPKQLAAHRKLVQEAYALLGAPHYDRYEFLLALSDHVGMVGLEHHRSSENSARPSYFTDWDATAAGRFLLPHEFAHSWNGKFRRPAGLATPDFNVPMRDALLWVYEGLTTYLQGVLAARSGLWSDDFTRQAWASVAANMDRNRPGRAWRDLQDTTGQPVISAHKPLSWVSWQREQDYYYEGELLWLDVDTRIRELTADKRSLDDFAHAFFEIDPGSLGPVTYTLADVIQTLERVAPFDWARYFTERLHTHGPGVPLDGLTRGGWKLVYGDTPTAYVKSQEAQRKAVDFIYSLGFAVSSETSKLSEVRWGGPAYDVGLTMGATLMAVNGLEYRPERLKAAIAAAKASGQPIELLVKDLDRFRTVRIAYFDGLKYPQLQRIENTENRLGAIMTPRRPATAESP